jgi:hypothetical protein
MRLLRTRHRRLTVGGGRQRPRGFARGIGDGSTGRDHATERFSHRRQVAVARVTRRSQSGQSADTSRLAFDQKVNVEAGIDPRQYTHGSEVARRPWSMLMNAA